MISSSRIPVTSYLWFYYIIQPEKRKPTERSENVRNGKTQDAVGGRQLCQLEFCDKNKNVTLHFVPFLLLTLYSVCYIMYNTRRMPHNILWMMMEKYYVENRGARRGRSANQ